MSHCRDPSRPARLPVPACDLLRGLREARGFDTLEAFAEASGAALSACVWLEAQSKSLRQLRPVLGDYERAAIGHYGVVGVYLVPLDARARLAAAIVANAGGA